MAGKLYIVATPIGNLEDITFRAISILKSVDLIACEDTRHAKKLLNYYKIKTPTTSYHEHNEVEKSKKLLSDLKKGKSIAIVSDAGTPSISDPGYRAVKLAAENNVEVLSIPGSSAIVTALTSSGLPTDSFSFFGFLPKTKKNNLELLEKIKDYEQTLIFFESPKRVVKSLNYMLNIFGNRSAALCRELTKIYEEITRGKIEELIEILERRKEIKGELVLIIEGKKAVKRSSLGNELDIVDKRLKKLKDLNISLKDAVKVVSEELKTTKNKIYKKALSIWDN